jgi:hypothetical protein
MANTQGNAPGRYQETQKPILAIYLLYVKRSWETTYFSPNFETGTMSVRS